MNAVVRHIVTDDVTQTNKIAMAVALLGCKKRKEVGVKKDKIGERKKAMVEKNN